MANHDKLGWLKVRLGRKQMGILQLSNTQAMSPFLTRGGAIPNVALVGNNESACHFRRRVEEHRQEAISVRPFHNI